MTPRPWLSLKGGSELPKASGTTWPWSYRPGLVPESWSMGNCSMALMETLATSGISWWTVMDRGARAGPLDVLNLSHRVCRSRRPQAARQPKRRQASGDRQAPLWVVRLPKLSYCSICDLLSWVDPLHWGLVPPSSKRRMQNCNGAPASSTPAEHESSPLVLAQMLLW